MGTLGFLLLIMESLIIMDFCLIGSITLLLGWRLPYRKLLKEGVILRDSPSGFDPNLKWDRYRELILTNGHLIFRDNFLTSVANVPIEDVKGYALRPMLLSKKKQKVMLKMRLNGEFMKFKFKTRRASDWSSAFAQVGIPEDPD
jgi:hypothetical protein